MEIQSDQELIVTIMSNCNGDQIYAAMFEIGKKDINRLIAIKLYLEMALHRINLKRRGK